MSDWTPTFDELLYEKPADNQVVPRAELPAYTLAMAQRIASKPLFALKMAKEAVNSAQDEMGWRQAMKTSFALHRPCHSHNMRVHGMPIDPQGLPEKLRASLTAAAAAANQKA